MINFEIMLDIIFFSIQDFETSSYLRWKQIRLKLLFMKWNNGSMLYKHNSIYI